MTIEALSIPVDGVTHAARAARWQLSTDERRVLEASFWCGAPSRQELSNLTGYSMTKVKALVSDLEIEGWLEEGAERDSSGGRRAIGVQLGANFGVMVGIELGATSADVALCKPNLEPLATRSVAVDVRNGPGVVMALVSNLIQACLVECGLPTSAVSSIGMGVPGPVEFSSGLLINPPIMPDWAGFSFREYFAPCFAAPVFVDNEVNLMALGELWNVRQGQAKSHPWLENFVVLKLGTGIGAGVIARGEVYRGADGAAGDVGHICVDLSGPQCHCGNIGCLEAIAGAPAIARAATAAGRSAASPVFARMLASKEQLTTHDVAQAAREGDIVANRIIQEAGGRVGQMLATLVNILNPTSILIGGGVSHLGPLLLASIRQSVYARSLPLSTRKLRLDYLRLGDAAGLRGASALALLEVIRGGAGV